MSITTRGWGTPAITTWGQGSLGGVVFVATGKLLIVRAQANLMLYIDADASRVMLSHQTPDETLVIAAQPNATLVIQGRR